MTATAEPTSQPATGPRARTQRYRAKNRRRLDYYPSAAAQAAIDAGLAANLSNCVAGVLDNLILAGQRALNAAEPASGHSDKDVVSLGKPGG